MLVDLLRVARSLAVAAHDLDLIRLDCLARVLHLECNILDQESPDLVAEAVSIEMTLERQPCLHLIRQNLCDAAIEVRQDLHRQLGLDATLADQVIESVRERHADAATAIELVKGLSGRRHRDFAV